MLAGCVCLLSVGVFVVPRPCVCMCIVFGEGRVRVSAGRAVSELLRVLTGMCVCDICYVCSVAGVFIGCLVILPS